MKQPAHAYGWEQEPAEERPSEFMHSTSSSLLSGYHVLPDPERPVRGRRSGFPSTGFYVTLLLLVAGCAMFVFARHVRG